MMPVQSIMPALSLRAKRSNLDPAPRTDAEATDA